MPRIENELLPTYAAQGLEVAAVNSERVPISGVQTADSVGWTLPIVLDLEREAFRHFHVPGQAFPLNVVIDRNGRITHIDNGPDLKAVEAAIVAALDN